MLIREKEKEMHLIDKLPIDSLPIELNCNQSMPQLSFKKQKKMRSKKLSRDWFLDHHQHLMKTEICLINCTINLKELFLRFLVVIKLVVPQSTYDYRYVPVKYFN